MAEFTEGETVYFKLGENGELYLVPPDEWGLDRGVLGHATIDRVDVDSKTIWFSPSLPKAVARRG